jgi:hypothetical protein
MAPMDEPRRPPLASVDVVRDELRRLGYLDSGLDRFVLGGGGAPGSPLRASLRVAARVGLVGGVVFGLSATLAAAGLDPRLLRQPQDLLVVAVYLVLAFAAFAGAAALAAGILAGWAGRAGHHPGPGVARNLGFAVALLAVGYVALWWRSHLAGAPLLAQTAGVGAGLLLSLALGRFAMLAAVAVLSAGGASRLPHASLSRRRALPVLAGALLVFGAVVGAAALLSREAKAEAPDFAVVPTGLRVRVLAIDGLERGMAEQMMARGEMPALAELVAHGAHAALRAEPERVPAIVWTTIATGRGPEAHGIRSAEARRVAGLQTPLGLDGERSRFAAALGAATDLLRLTRKEPPSAALRSVKAFWNVASDTGLRVGVVNWWATWPADPVNGYLVTDRALLRMEKGGPPEGEVHPPEAIATLRALPREDDAERARRIDRFHVEAAEALRGSAPPDLEALYLPGLDIFTMQQLGEAPASDLAALDAKLAAVRSEYRFVDGLVGEAAAGRARNDVLVLVGDPGRLARSGARPGQGLLVLCGGPIVPADLGTVSERDVAPTVLHLLGLPRSRELDGHVLEAALSGDFRRAHPVRSVDSYGRRPAGRPADSAFDRDVLDELKSLGYVQ